MKVSLKWVKRIDDLYGCAANPAPDGPEALIERIGRQLGGIDEIEKPGEKYQGIVVAKVVECAKHPDADKLSVCLIDDGKVTKNVKRDKNGLVEVVCGAPNIAKGQLVAWIPPGATVPATYDKDPFVLEAKELRGVVSNGMIASLKELAIGDSHEGILVIDQPAKPGQAFADVYDLRDHVIDIENKMFTHRPDLFGILGVAREIAGIQGQVFKSPDWYKENASAPKLKGDGLKLTVKNHLPKLVPRFTAIVIRDIEIRPSPIWMQTYLSRVDIKPINNIVDLTNFYMHGTAQPLHAYDYDKVGNQLTVRKPKKGESLKLLGGKVIKLQPDDIVIASADMAIGLGGIMGGADTEVSAETKNIILECANFGPLAIRKSAMAHGLFTDAATRFTKGQSSRQNLAVLTHVANTMMHPSIAGGRVASQVFDIKSSRPKPAIVKTDTDFINSRLGLGLTAAQIKRILANVEFMVTASGNKFKIEVPFWRTDIEIPEDIVEEVGRLYGYDKLKLQLPTKDLTPAAVDQSLQFKSSIRDRLNGAGANEVLTYSFTSKKLIEMAGQSADAAYRLRNAASPDFEYYRQSLTPSLLEKIPSNIRVGYDNFVLYEIGVGHLKGLLDGEKLPAEFSRLALVYSSSAKSEAAPFYQARRYADLLLSEGLGLPIEYLHLSGAMLSQDWQAAAKAFEPARSAAMLCQHQIVGLVGEPTQKLMAGLKLPVQTAQLEIDIALVAQLADKISRYEPLNRFPSLDQDLTLKAPQELKFAELDDFLKAKLTKLAEPHGYVVSSQPLDIFQKPGDKRRQTTWRLTFAHPDRTLTTAEINELLDKLADESKQRLKADRI